MASLYTKRALGICISVFLILIGLVAVSAANGAQGPPEGDEKPAWNFGDAGTLAGETGKKIFGDTATGDLQTVVGSVIRGALILIGAIFLLMMVYGGYNWMIDRGDSERMKVAKDTITRAIVGIIIVFGAYAITNFVVGRLARTATGGGGAAPAAAPAGNGSGGAVSEVSSSEEDISI